MSLQPFEKVKMLATRICLQELTEQIWFHSSYSLIPKLIKISPNYQQTNCLIKKKF